VKLRVPVFGKLGHKICLARFSRTLSTLLVSGVPILQAMETVAGTVGNEIISEAIMNARARIREGDRIGEPLKKPGDRRKGKGPTPSRQRKLVKPCKSRPASERKSVATNGARREDRELKGWR
jgi:hypothetical protein